ncbi:aminopeptidase N [Thalassotalea marina]|uniref:Aminopeptidase N n=1 Tax=Thalassotalea marina TaxID=1673741 RepID=A0A919BIT0_9GAMM|nr:aminopeptidase N [Thalassotalea marina]GHF93037.1 aminopeptidase N [Thalassotalea marina]
MAATTARVLADYQPSQFQIITTDLIFELEDNKTLVTNRMSIKRIDKEAKILSLDGEQLELLAVSLNAQGLDDSQFQQDENSLHIKVNQDEFELTITTHIDPQGNKALEGLYKSGGAFCTQCEAEGFRRITYYLDRPDVMATFTTKVIADKSQYPFLLSNGNKIDSGDLEQGKHFVTWHDPFPKPSYLFALVAGDFDLVSDVFTTCSGRQVDLEIYVDKGNAPKANHAMDSLKRSMKWDEDVFGLEYDLDIYMIVAVDFFNMGAMENKGLNIFNSKFVLADQQSATDKDYFNIEAVIAHEYFHNWTGNRVTCRDWFQLSLKEGLTVFRDQQFSADMHSAAVTRIENVSTLRAMQFPEDDSPMAHPIRPEKVLEMNNFYTMTVYEKGSEVIRMIYTLLGKENFRKGMDLYFERFDGMAVTCDDFVDAMADASHIDLTMFKRWYSQSGTPKLMVREQFDAATGQYRLHIQQINEPSDVQPEKHYLHIPVGIEIISENDSASHLLELKAEEGSWTFEGYKEKPVLGFLTNFSAPVKVEFEQTDEELQLLMAKANDAFIRWDCGQTLVVRQVKQLLADKDFVLPSSLLDSVKHILTADEDPALRAEQLTLPSFDEVVEHLTDVEPIEVVNAISAIKTFIAKGLAETFMTVYQQMSTDTYKNDGPSIGQRALKNVCLDYLSETEQANELLKQQYQQADNMTDTLAVLASAAKNQLDIFDELMLEFEQVWSGTRLVMDKWFSLQAMAQRSDMFAKLESLEQHALFDIENPNRARSLIGVFANSNPKYFYCPSGKGYQFLTKHIKKLNTINPQVASRLITPLIQFKRLNAHHQQLIKIQLQELSSLANLSNDLKEKLDAALNI